MFSSCKYMCLQTNFYLFHSNLYSTNYCTKSGLDLYKSNIIIMYCTYFKFPSNTELNYYLLLCTPVSLVVCSIKESRARVLHCEAITVARVI